MKQNGTSLHILERDINLIEDMGDSHASTSLDTPMKPDAHVISDEEKMNQIAANFAEIMDTLG